MTERERVMAAETQKNVVAGVEREKERGVTAGPIDERDLCRIREAICIQTEKVYDSCREKDCIENLEVHGIPQCLVRDAIDVACRDVEVKDVIIDVEPLRFRRGFYTVTVTYVFCVTVELFFRNRGPIRKTGVALFTKTVILFGSQGKVKIFKAKFRRDRRDIALPDQDNGPIGKVEVAEPICLAARIHECETSGLGARDVDIINSILNFIQTNVSDVDVDVDGNNNDVDVTVNQTNIINIGGATQPRILVTIGLFTIIKLVRFVQVLVPAFGFCRPPVCVAALAEAPCELFDTIEFPRDAFFPPQKHEVEEEFEEEPFSGGCHKN